MKANIRRKVSMARRALDFATAHPVADSGFTAALTRLGATTDQADTLGMLQEAGRVRQHAAVDRRASLRQAMRSHLLRRLCRVAQIGAATHPELAAKYILPPISGPNRSFLLKARTLLDDAIADKTLLTSLGLGDTLIDELTQAVAEFETATETAHTARADHIGASAELNAIASKCTADVDVIDTFMRKSYAGDELTLAAWDAARNVVGPFTRKAAAEPPPAPAPAVSTEAPDAGKAPG